MTQPLALILSRAKGDPYRACHDRGGAEQEDHVTVIVVAYMGSAVAVA
jgi:hypothetical protein